MTTKIIKQGLIPLFFNPSSSSKEVTEKGLQLVDNSSKINYQPKANSQINLFNATKLKNLVFLSKKGSQKNNPNIISYNFQAPLKDFRS